MISVELNKIFRASVKFAKENVKEGRERRSARKQRKICRKRERGK